MEERFTVSRRELLKIAGISAGASILGQYPVMAGPFDMSDFEKLVPPDKKLSPEWLASLTARGERRVCRGRELDKIGMPIGGICAGTMYLSGDGRLWLWDIFNRYRSGILPQTAVIQGETIGPGGGSNYVNPSDPVSPVDQGFKVELSWNGKTEERRMDRTGWKDVAFTGEYPMGFVTFSDPDAPVTASLEAFSPFIPLNTDDSSIPCTVMRYTLTNTTTSPVWARLTGWLENAVCLYAAAGEKGIRRNRVLRVSGATLVQGSAEEAPDETPSRAPIVFADFEGDNYGEWTVEGTAFGTKPAGGTGPNQQVVEGYRGKRLVNSFFVGGDDPKGRLTSPEFTIERPWVSLLVGGGSYKGETCVNLLVDGKAVMTATGRDSERLEWVNWNVAELTGRKARIEIVDERSGPWGHINVDQIEFGDQPAGTIPVPEREDFGTLALALLDSKTTDKASADIESPETAAEASRPFGRKLTGSVGRQVRLRPGSTATLTFVVAWHFPNLRIDGAVDGTGRWYDNRFESASEVVAYVSANAKRLFGDTRLWHDTWYDSTLPYWFLDRTFAPVSTLATTTAHRFKSGRFWGWEGIGCCHGTCTHVWQYAHAMARLFPDLERDLREKVDLGISFNPQTGGIGMRGEFDRNPAIDGQAGRILGMYREHQMSPDSAFLKRIWPRAKKALEYLIAQDGNDDGILEGAQWNTLDSAWYGPVSWLSSLYVASVRAGEEMAREMGDAAFAERCAAIARRGTENLVRRTWNGEYFIQDWDRNHPEAIGSGEGCEADQVYGQSWAFQVNLGRILPEDKTRLALKSLWKYNFCPDVGPYRRLRRAGRWYAVEGEAGLLTCTFPRPQPVEFKDQPNAWSAMYFNECWTGLEYQVAGHMLWEGLVTEGLAVTRAVYDRHSPARRNPYNEVECSDHYARGMASYGVYIGACGFEYHGPKGHIGFAPRLTPDDFRCAFTSAEGWGTFAQKKTAKGLEAAITPRWGRVALKTVALELPEGVTAAKATVSLAGKAVAASQAQDGRRLVVTLQEKSLVEAGKTLKIAVS